MQGDDIRYKVQKLIKKEIDQIPNSKQVKKYMSKETTDVDVWLKGKYVPLNEELGIYELQFEDKMDIIKYYNNKIRNQLLTRKGEIPNKIDVGSELYDYVFFNDKLFSEEQVKVLIRDTLKEYVPDVIINSLEDIVVERTIDQETGDIYVFITINYELPYIGKTYLNLELKKD